MCIQSTALQHCMDVSDVQNCHAGRRRLERVLVHLERDGFVLRTAVSRIAREVLHVFVICTMTSLSAGSGRAAAANNHSGHAAHAWAMANTWDFGYLPVTERNISGWRCHGTPSPAKELFSRQWPGGAGQNVSTFNWPANQAFDHKGS